MITCKVCGLELDEKIFSICPMCQTPVISVTTACKSQVALQPNCETDGADSIHNESVASDLGNLNIQEQVAPSDGTPVNNDVDKISVETEPNNEHEQLPEKNDVRSFSFLADEMPISSCVLLDVRSRNVLINNGIDSIGKLRLTDKDSISKMKSAGKKTVSRISDLIDLLCQEKEISVKNEKGPGREVYYIDVASNYSQDISNPSCHTETERQIDVEIKYLGLSVRAVNALHGAGILKLSDLVQKTENEILTIKNLGTKSYSEILKMLESRGLGLGMHITVTKSYADDTLENYDRGLSNGNFDILKQDSFLEISKKYKVGDIISALNAASIAESGKECISRLIESIGVNSINTENDGFGLEILTVWKVKPASLAKIRKTGCVTIGDLKTVSHLSFLMALISIEDMKAFQDAIISFQQPRKAVLRRMVKLLLDERFYEILYLRSTGFTLAEIGERFNVTRERIRQIERKALFHLSNLCGEIKKELLLEKQFFFADDLKMFVEDEDVLSILAYCFRQDETLEYLDYAECFLVVGAEIPNNEELIVLSKEIVGEGTNIEAQIEEIEQRLSNSGFEYLTFDSWKAFLCEQKYAIRGSYAFPRDNRSFAALCEIEIARYFPDGIKLTQYDKQQDCTDILELRGYLRSDFGVEGPENDRAFTAKITDRLIIRDFGKYIAPASLRIEESTFSTVVNWIDNNESPSLYYAEIFDQFSGLLSLYANIDNKHYLHGVLRYLFPDRYQYCRDYLIKTDAPKNVVTSFAQRLREYLINNDIKVIALKDIKKEFHGFPDIYITMKIDESGLFTSLSNSRFILTEMLALNSSDKEFLEGILLAEMKKHNGYCSAGLLGDAVLEKNPIVLKEYGIETGFDVFSLFSGVFTGRFVFKRPHIFELNSKMPEDINHQTVTEYLNGSSAEIRYSRIVKIFSDFKWAPMAMDRVVRHYKTTMYRVDSDLFVTKEKLDLSEDQLASIITAIEGKMRNGYVPVSSIVQFWDFPEIGFEWNSYLVETIVDKLLNYRFKTISPKVTDIRYVRSIVLDADNPISDYESLVVDCLQKSGIKEIEEDRFANYLAVNGLASLSVPAELKNSSKIQFKEGVFSIE